jgi:predicted phage tail protein
MLYSDCAYMALTFDSEFFGATVPVRTYDLVGVQINVPLNYDPVTRTYATTGPGTSGGTWDGVSYQQAATDNPAFIALDLVTNNRYGCGLPASSLQYTKWDLYTIAQYCDGLVPDGFGGMEPRYTCNIWMSNRDDAYRVLQTICSIWRGMTYWGAGSLRFTADMPAGISQIVNQADVIDGNFTYEGTSLKSRHTLVIANYLDPTNYWQPTPIVYQDPELTVTSILGPNILSINAIGCTTAGQAYRQGNWLIAGEQACTETVTYKAGLDHLLVRPGDIIAIHDPAYAGVRFGGRILATGTTSSGGMPALVIELDQVLTPEDGEVYTLDFELTDGTLAQGITVLGWIQNTGVTPNTTSALVPAPTGTLTAGTPNSAPEYGALWLLMSKTLVPRQFRIIGVTIPQRGPGRGHGAAARPGPLCRGRGRHRPDGHALHDSAQPAIRLARRAVQRDGERLFRGRRFHHRPAHDDRLVAGVRLPRQVVRYRGIVGHGLHRNLERSRRTQLRHR